MPKKSKKPDFKVNKLRKFIFKKNLYSIIWKNKRFKGGHLAECESPESNCIHKRILISPKALADQKELLRVLIDESVHTHWFLIDNNDVANFAEELSDFLWKVGYKLPSNDPKLPNKTD